MFGGSPGDSRAVAGSHKPVRRTRKDGTEKKKKKGYRGNAKRFSKMKFCNRATKAIRTFEKQMFGGSPGDSCAVAGSHKPVGRTRKDGTDLDPEKGYRGNAKAFSKMKFCNRATKAIKNIWETNVWWIARGSNPGPPD